jgi:hypothetical protein
MLLPEFERDGSMYRIQKQAANGKKMNSSLTGFSKKLADICCILPVAWPCINADTTEHIMCCDKEIWKLLTPNKLVANLMPYVVLCWTLLTWCFKNMSMNIKKFTTLNVKQKHYLMLQMKVTLDLYYLFECVFRECNGLCYTIKYSL